MRIRSDNGKNGATGDLAAIFRSDTVKPVKLESEAFLKAIAERL